MVTEDMGHPIDILLVEDNRTDILLAREGLRETKMINRLHVVETGTDAMDFLHKQGKYANAPRPDLILLDLNLPKKDGREVLQEIKDDADLKIMPVVILTTSQEERDIIKAYGLHANCYITKPVNFEKFKEIVQAIETFWFSVVRLPPHDDADEG